MPYKEITGNALIGSVPAQWLTLALSTRSAAFYNGLSDTVRPLGHMRSRAALSHVRVFVRTAGAMTGNETFALSLRSISFGGVEEETPLVTLDGTNLPAPGAYEVATDIIVQELTPGTVLELVTDYTVGGGGGGGGPPASQPHLSVSLFFY